MSGTSDKFSKFLENLRSRFQAKRLLLTASVTATVQYFNMHSEFSQYAEYFDLVALLQLSVISKVNAVGVDVESMEFAKTELYPASVSKKVDRLIDWGVNASKIILR